MGWCTARLCAPPGMETTAAAAAAVENRALLAMQQVEQKGLQVGHIF